MNPSINKSISRSNNSAVLFDMDGVLVDVSMSYRRAVQATVRHFLGKTVSFEEIREYKNRGGLNNDWDLTASILSEYGIPVERRSIIDVFQQLYLGNMKDNRFNGFISAETCMIPPEIIERISSRFPTGVVTGRPRQEALYALDRFGLRQYFPVIIAMEDVPPGRGKPDPFGLKLALDRLAVTGGWYIGDTVDDMKAAKAAGLIPIGYTGSATSSKHQPQLLKQNGASRIIGCPQRLIKSFAGGPGGQFFKSAPLAAGGIK